MENQSVNFDVVQMSFNQSDGTAGNAGFWENGQWRRWNDYYQPYYNNYYPTYIHQEDKVTKAFRVIEELLKIGVIKGITVKEFIELTNKIAGII